MSSTIVSSASLHAKRKPLFHPEIQIMTATGVTCSGKNRAAGIIEEAYGLEMIKSVTTRPLRKGQDLEYEAATIDEFHKMRMQLLWAFQNPDTGHWYGTRTLLVDQAIRASKPSVMHVIHDRVQELQRYALKKNGMPQVFSFLIVCDNEDVLRQRFFARDANANEKDANNRFKNFAEDQRMYRKSGLYHALIENHDNSKTKADIFQEMMSYLSKPIPRPRRF